MIDITGANWQDRAHFFAAASTMMRHILVDHARARQTDKRGGEFQKIELGEAVSFSDNRNEKNFDVLALDQALRQLAEFDEQQSRIVELRFFGGLTVEETAEVLRISSATVKREWALAKAWLYGKIQG
jgi:RNA polymerase sigma factor (TIGR02999 family)